MQQPSPPLVAVVILNWNKAALTAACVRAVAAMDYPRVLTLVVDNGSEAGSLAPIESLDVPFELIRNPRNLGFTGGVNTGIRRALETDADYIWLLNNDAIPAVDALSRLVTAMEGDSRIGMASPVIRNADANNEIDFSGGLWDGRTIATTADPAVYERWAGQTPERIWLVGTALLMRRRLIDAIGFYDERFFAYWEDVDYSLRAIAAGYRNVVVQAAEALHSAGAVATDSHSKQPHYYYYMARNELLFARKHLGWWAGRRPLWWAARRELARIGRLGAHWAAVDAIFLGLRDGLGFRRGPYDPNRRLPRPVRKALLAANRRFFDPR